MPLWEVYLYTYSCIICSRFNSPLPDITSPFPYSSTFPNRASGYQHRGSFPNYPTPVSPHASLNNYNHNTSGQTRDSLRPYLGYQSIGRDSNSAERDSPLLQISPQPRVSSRLPLPAFQVLRPLFSQNCLISIYRRDQPTHHGPHATPAKRQALS